MGESKSEKRKLFEQEAMPHLDILFTTALYLAGDEQEANDLCQETILRAYRSFHQYTAGTNCRAWLLTILRNVFRATRARRKPDLVASTEKDFERILDREISSNDRAWETPETLLLKQSTDRRVQEALGKLPEDYKAALLLVFVEDLTYQEAAAVLEVPVGTVRSRIFRARALLRRALESFDGLRRLARAQT